MDGEDPRAERPADLASGLEPDGQSTRQAPRRGPPSSEDGEP